MRDDVDTTGGRGLAVCLLASLALLAPATADEDEDARARRLEAAKQAQAEAERAFRERVDAAIDRGRDALAAMQEEDGTWPVRRSNNFTQTGEQGLVLFTLAKCGMDERDVAMEQGVERLDRMVDAFPMAVAPGWAHARTYTVSLLVLFYDALYGKERKRKREWRYGRRGNPCRYPRSVRARVRDLVDWLVEAQSEGGWRYPDSPWPDQDNPKQDLSHTQYALLALQVASRCGIDVDPDVYRKAAAYVMGLQPAEGPEVRLWIENAAWAPGVERYPRFVEAAKTRARGYPYTPGGGLTGAMCVAGLSSLAIAKDRLRAAGELETDLEGQIDRSLLDGLAWLSHHFAVDTNPGHGQGHWHYYYLYGLERAGVLLGQRFVGKHDWYREGAEHLLAHQTEGGGWPDLGAGSPHHHDTTIQTCFALLFLKRATYAPHQPVGPAITGG